MIALAAAVLLGLPLQDEGRLKQGWPKLVEAWKAVSEHQPSLGTAELDDESLKAAGKLQDAFDAAGLFTEEGEYLPLALKHFLKIRARGLGPSGGKAFIRGGLVVRLRINAGAAPARPEGSPSVEADPMGALLDSLKKSPHLGPGGLDDDDKARESIKVLGIMSDDTPPALRGRILTLIRSLALGEAYPEPPKATGEQTKEIRERIAQLGHEQVETRRKAMRDLLGAGEASLPIVREALNARQTEIVAGARELLGFGHSPWTPMQGTGAPPDWIKLFDSVWDAVESDKRIWIESIEFFGTRQAEALLKRLREKARK